jgi:hypothetical protein
MSRDIYIASLVKEPLSITDSNNGYRFHHTQHHYNSVVNRPASSFVVGEKPEESRKRTWEICTEIDREMERDGKERNRRLVSLFEANEVARRVAGKTPTNRTGGGQIVVNGGLVEGEGKPDVVSEWMDGL